MEFSNTLLRARELEQNRARACLDKPRRAQYHFNFPLALTLWGVYPIGNRSAVDVLVS